MHDVLRMLPLAVLLANRRAAVGPRYEHGPRMVRGPERPVPQPTADRPAGAGPERG